jgi:hypothetical protein
MKLHYYILGDFTDTAFTGNRLAVMPMVVGDASLSRHPGEGLRSSLQATIAPPRHTRA